MAVRVRCCQWWNNFVPGPDRRTNGGMEGRTDGRTDWQTDRITDGRRKWWTNGQMDGQTHEQTKLTDGLTNGSYNSAKFRLADAENYSTVNFKVWFLNKIMPSNTACYFMSKASSILHVILFCVFYLTDRQLITNTDNACQKLVVESRWKSAANSTKRHDRLNAHCR